MAPNLDRYRSAEARLWESVGVKPDERTMRLPEGELRAIEFGHGPPTVMVHGAQSSAAVWAPFAAHLTGRRFIAIDRPGCGLSQPQVTPAGADPIDAFERFGDRLIVDVLDALEIEQASVVATSMGAYFAMRGAAANPDRISRLALIAYPFGAPMAAIPISMRMAGIPYVGELTARIPPTAGVVKLVLGQLGLGPALADGRVTDEFFDWFMSLVRDTHTVRNEIAAYPKLVTPIRGQNPRMVLGPDVLDRIVAPVKFIWGADDPVGGADVAHDFAPMVRDADLTLIPDSGHAPWVDEPERCGALTSAFLVA